jgi:hypothetical protein
VSSDNHECTIFMIELKSYFKSFLFYVTMSVIVFYLFIVIIITIIIIIIIIL